MAKDISSGDDGVVAEMDQSLLICVMCLLLHLFVARYVGDDSSDISAWTTMIMVFLRKTVVFAYNNLVFPKENAVVAYRKLVFLTKAHSIEVFWIFGVIFPFD